MLFASLVFIEKGLARAIRFFLISGGMISSIGLIGTPLNNKQLQNIEIIWYTVFAIIVLFLFGLAFIRRMR